MRATPTLSMALIAAALIAAKSVPAQVRAVAMAGDIAPGITLGTFKTFPVTGCLPVCDSNGRTTFYATANPGGSGLWTEASGSLSLLALTLGPAGWLPGSGTYQSFGQAAMSDDGHVVFSGTASVGGIKTGLWARNGAAAQPLAGDGIMTTLGGGPASYALGTSFTPDSYGITRNGRAMLLAATAGGAVGLWSFDGWPAVATHACAAADPALAGAAHVAAMSPPVMNSGGAFAMYQDDWSGSQLVRTLASGACGLLAPAVAAGDPSPPTGSFPAGSTLQALGFDSPLVSDLNDAGVVVARATLAGAGITAANDEIVVLGSGGAPEVVLREGDGSSALATGETFAPGFVSSGGANQQPDLVSSNGSVAMNARILPSGAWAAVLYGADHQLHLLERDGDPAPGYPGWVFAGNGGGPTPMAMNAYGQVALVTTIENTGSLLTAQAVFMTDHGGQLTGVFRSGDAATVRMGVTGSLSLLSTTAALASGGTDGRARNFSDHGEFFFAGTLVVPGIPLPSVHPGVFAAQGPDLSAFAGIGPPHAASRLSSVAPNPTSGPATIRYEIARPGMVRLEIFDLAGRRVTTLRDGFTPVGSYAERWSGADAAGRLAPPGTYFARLEAPGLGATRSLIEVR